ncbi:MAG: hypothetical protein R3F65_02790 [bacterium]
MQRWLVVLGVVLLAACNGEEPDDGDPADAAPPVAACQNGEDDDRDGLTDLDDPGCDGPDDDDEVDPIRAACQNGVDDDGDGAIDGDDPGCDGPDDDDETDPAVPACQNGEDDDGDGAIDLEDRGCASARDDDESDEPPLPACSNGVDDDDDGFIDFPADPGCGSAGDDDEFDMRMPLPQCADEQDNDDDGLVDVADPGCSSVADPREADPDEPPVCFNGLDDDGDGIIDFPAEPGCSAAGDGDEADPPNAPACGNGLDDDGDGRVDYPDDPGCAGTGDNDEADPSRAPACADGVDNDGDGATDFPDDLGCDAAADATEQAGCGVRRVAAELAPNSTVRGDSSTAGFTHEGSCGGRGAPEVPFVYRLDQAVEAIEITALAETRFATAIYVRRGCTDPDSEVACARQPAGESGHTLRIDEPAPGTYYIFLDGAAGRGGQFAMQIEEIPLAACRNGVDDDGDGRVDYPEEPGCQSPADRDETDPEPLPQCADDLDNDGDGEVDFPLDIGCIAASDDDEVDACGQGVRFLEYPVGAPFVDGLIEGGTNNFSGSCGGQGRPERIYRYDNPFNARLRFSVDNAETAQATTLYVRGARCTSAQSELGCSTGIAPTSKGTVTLDRAAPGEYFVFVDSGLGAGAFRLTVQVDRLPPGCSDGVDNDEDGFTDGDDLGCEAPDDEDERDPPAIAARAACANGLDDDGDGRTDYPYDPGCTTRGAADEADPAALPACGNGEDDDGDGLVDFPADPGCFAAADDDEGGNARVACNNRIDDDNDGLLDHPYDPGCAGPGSRSETDPEPAPACADELDNDRDGLVDFPYDPGCAAAGAPSEQDPPAPTACLNRIDDDGDGLADFPRDPGCESAADDDEADPAFAPACANGRDDDQNGRIDWPDDPGCDSAADASERDGGRVRVRCSDGLDNDDDGLIDLADPGCGNARDDDEEDLVALPWCADGVDNDGDGLTDWPEDEGCAAQGDECEQTGYGQCGGVCLDLQNDAQNCGRCGRICEPGVECIEGFCGGLLTFEGIRENVPDADLGGWEVCHRDLYSDGNTVVADMVRNCDGEYVMYGCRRVNSPNWQLLAMGEREQVFRNTGDRNNVLNPHNGVEWYFSENTSIGFVAPGTGVSRNSCDTNNVQPQFRLCWHTGGARFNGGYRCGANTGLNGDRNWERVVWTSR